MQSRATRAFWRTYRELPPEVRSAALRQCRLWRADHHHPSLRFKKIGRFWSARVGQGYRALGVLEGDTVVWFWIGDHDEYDGLLSGG